MFLLFILGAPYPSRQNYPIFLARAFGSREYHMYALSESAREKHMFVNGSFWSVFKSKPQITREGQKLRNFREIQAEISQFFSLAPFGAREYFIYVLSETTHEKNIVRAQGILKDLQK